eukprot:FR742757.1.p3 GENE.FR742757.1~~FR742757.1.p3  ORF type:complete len:134 (-),score=56.58 FR742757.1:683-1084(-)
MWGGGGKPHFSPPGKNPVLWPLVFPAKGPPIYTPPLKGETKKGGVSPRGGGGASKKLGGFPLDFGALGAAPQNARKNVGATPPGFLFVLTRPPCIWGAGKGVSKFCPFFWGDCRLPKFSSLAFVGVPGVTGQM